MDETDPTQSAVRQAIQRLESLRRAGVDRIPIGPRPAAPGRPPIPGRPPVEPPSIAPTRPTPPRPVEPPRAAEPAAIPETVAPPAASPAPAPRPIAVAMASLFDEVALEGPDLDPAARAAALASMAVEVAACVKCPLLAESRTQTVFGEGSPTARLMFVGEAPGADEDATGRPFVGRSGQLLNDMITKGMGLRREDVFIANVLKSRPPGNRDPLPDEVRNCRPYLERQISIVRPEFLCLLGKPATQALLETSLPLGRLRGKWHRYRGIPAIVTWHPAYLLRNPASKKEAWADLQMLMRAMGIATTGRGA